MNKAMIDSIGGRDDLVEKIRQLQADSDNGWRVDAYSLMVFRAFLSFIDAEVKPVYMPKPERLDGNGYGYYFDMDDVFKALDDANIRYLTVK